MSLRKRVFKQIWKPSNFVGQHNLKLRLFSFFFDFVAIFLAGLNFLLYRIMPKIALFFLVNFSILSICVTRSLPWFSLVVFPGFLYYFWILFFCQRHASESPAFVCSRQKSWAHILLIENTVKARGWQRIRGPTLYRNNNNNDLN